MIVGIALFALSAVVERSGRKLGTVLAVLPVLLWFRFLVKIQLDGHLGAFAGSTARDLLLSRGVRKASSP